MVEVVGSTTAVLLACILTASVAMHSIVDPPWWSTAISRHLMAYMASFAAVADVIAVRILTGSSLDVEWFLWLRTVVFATTPIVAAWRLWIQIQLHKQAVRARRRREPPRDLLTVHPAGAPVGCFTNPLREGTTVFKRDPSLYISAIAAILGVGVSLGLRGLDAHQAAAIMAVITAAGGAWTAVHTRPVAPSLFTGLLGAGALLAAAYTIDIPQDTLAAVQVAVSSLVGILTWQSVSPTASVAQFASVARPDGR